MAGSSEMILRRAPPCQGRGRGFESLRPLQNLPKLHTFTPGSRNVLSSCDFAGSSGEAIAKIVKRVGRPVKDFHAKFFAHQPTKRSPSDSVENARRRTSGRPSRSQSISNRSRAIPFRVAEAIRAGNLNPFSSVHPRSFRKTWRPGRYQPREPRTAFRISCR